MTTYKHVYEVTFETHHNYDNASSFVTTVHAWGQRYFPTAKKVSITPIVPVPAVGQVWRSGRMTTVTILHIDGKYAMVRYGDSEACATWFVSSIANDMEMVTP